LINGTSLVCHSSTVKTSFPILKLILTKSVVQELIIMADHKSLTSYNLYIFKMLLFVVLCSLLCLQCLDTAAWLAGHPVSHM